MSSHQQLLPQKSMKALSAWKLSRVVHREVFLDGSLATSGPQLDRLKERLRDSRNYLQRSAMMMKVISAIFALAVYVLTISGTAAIDPNHINRSIFSYSTSNSMVLVFQFMFVFTYGLIGLIGFFSSSAFKYLHTLPISRTKIKLTAYLTYFRLINWQLISILIGFPIASGIGAFVNEATWIGVLLSSFISLCISFVNVIFLFSLMITVSLYIAKKIYKPTGVSKFQTVMQIVVSSLYAIVSLGASLAITFLMDLVQTGFNVESQTVNIVINLVIYPFGLTHLHSIIMIGFIKGWHLIPSIYIWVSLGGFLLCVGASYLLFRRSMIILSSLVKEEVHESKQQAPKDVVIKLELDKPIQAIYKKDMRYIFRNFSSTIYFIFPILMPLVILIQTAAIDPFGGYSAFFQLSIFTFFYSGMIIAFSIMCVTAPESDTGGLLYILPSKMSDIFRVKRRIMFFSLSLSALAPTLINIILALRGRFSMTENYLIPAILMSVSYYVTYFYGTELALTLYSRFFGKMRNKYTIQMLNVKLKFGKIALGIVILYIVSYIPLITGLFMGILLGGSPLYGAAITLGTAVILMLVIRILSFKNFNSHKL